MNLFAPAPPLLTPEERRREEAISIVAAGILRAVGRLALYALLTTVVLFFVGMVLKGG